MQAGLHDGTIAVFNVSIASSEPVLDSWSVACYCCLIVIQTA